MVTVPTHGDATPARKMDPITMTLFIVLCVIVVVLFVRAQLEHSGATRSTRTHTHSAVSRASVISNQR